MILYLKLISYIIFVNMGALPPYFTIYLYSTYYCFDGAGTGCFGVIGTVVF